MSHYYVPMREPCNAYGLLSDGATKDTAIIFVHGFDGDPITTWRDFQTLIDADKFAALYQNCDLFFYSYSNFKTLLPFNVQQCLAFIRGIFPSPQTRLFGFEDLSRELGISETLSKAVEATLPRQYKNLTLVGHSIGGLLIRGAMWEAFRAAYDPSMAAPGQSFPDYKLEQSVLEADPILRADLSLFAPAHLGISASGWLGSLIHVVSAISWIGPALVNALGFIMPTVVSLQGQDTFLSDIRKYTEEHSEKFPTVPALRARILWGSGEWLVEAWQYKWDKPVDFEKGVAHTSVCKPNPKYTLPVEFVGYGPKRQTATS